MNDTPSFDESTRSGAVPAGGTPAVVHASAVSWGAIFAGAVAAAALSLILLILGTGLGLSAVSPWASHGISAGSFGVSTVIWVTFTQLAAAGIGGYLAGRLRTKWIAVHTDEVYFRDTAHGFLAWSAATLATAALLSSVIGSIVSSGVQTAATVAGGVGAGATVAAARSTAAPGAGSGSVETGSGAVGYFVDALFRKDLSAASAAPSPAPENATTGAKPDPVSTTSPSEVTQIFVNSVRTGPLPADDLRYVGQIVAQRTGMTQQESEKRVSDVYARLQSKLRAAEAAAKDAADRARKVAADTALWLFISLLIGAFVASFAATYGGRERDR